MAHINVIKYEDAEGKLKETYDKIISERGRLSNVLSVQSLDPEAMLAHLYFYLTIMFGESTLKRCQREMIAVAVSTANNCEYCIYHHSAALNIFWRSEERIRLFIKDPEAADLPMKEQLMTKYAIALTKDPHIVDKEKFTQKLQDAGLEDKTILELTQIISYFNFVNRMVLALGVELELEKGVGFKY